jgi:ABC-type sugar transport system substrate-binding protein
MSSQLPSLPRLVHRLPRQCLLALALWPSWAAAFSVVFLDPGKHDEPYWVSAAQVMQAAAHDLDIELEVLYAERDPLRMIELARKVTARPHKPDYLILTNEWLSAPPMMQAAEHAGIPYLLAYNALNGEQRRRIGAPRQQYRHWLGSLVPDNVYAGEITAAALLQAANQLPLGKRPYKLIVMAGDHSTPASVERLQGLEKVLGQAKGKVEVVQTVYGEWKRETAHEQMNWLLARTPDVDLVWAANDLMAFGAIDSLKEHGKTPGRDVLLSAVNNNEAAMQARYSGQLSALAAGHFMTGAFALVMLYDYRHGRDFADLGLEMRTPMFSLIGKEQAHRYLQKFTAAGAPAEDLDFQRFSRYARPKLSRYRFNFGNILE